MAQAPPGTSHSVEDLFRCVSECNLLSDAGQVKQALDLLGAPDEAQGASVVGQTLMGFDDDAQTGRVHELQPAQIKHQELCPGTRNALEFCRQGRAGGQVELPADHDDRRPAFAPYLYVKNALHAVAEPTGKRDGLSPLA